MSKVFESYIIKNLKRLKAEKQQKMKNVQAKQAKEVCQQKNKKILIMNLDLGHKIENVSIYENDVPEILAQNIVDKHNLDKQVKLIITDNINKAIDQLNSTQNTTQDTLESFSDVQQQEVDQIYQKNTLISDDSKDTFIKCEQDLGDPLEKNEIKDEIEDELQYEKLNFSNNQSIQQVHQSEYYSVNEELKENLDTMNIYYQTQSQKNKSLVNKSVYNLYSGNKTHNSEYYSLNKSKDLHVQKSSKYPFKPTISRISMDINKKRKNVFKQDVFSRLQKDGKERKCRIRSVSKQRERLRSKQQSGKQKSRSRSKLSQNSNIWDRLYDSGVKQKWFKSKKVRQHQMKLAQSLQNNFKPKLNEISKQINFQKDKNLKNNTHRSKKQSKATLRRLKQQFDMKECSFKPKISEISQLITSDRSHKRNIFQKLHNESFLKKKQQMLNEKVTKNSEYTYQPQINQSYQSNGTLMESQKGKENIPVYMRLMEFNNYKKKKQQKMQQDKDYQDQFDVKTGQPLFQPLTGRGPNYCESINQNIGERLYNHGKHLQEKREYLKEMDVQSQCQGRALLKKSDDMVHNMKIKMLQEIFNQLDSDQDGFISATKVDISKVETEVLNVFANLLCEMEDENIKLDAEQFISAAYNILNDLTIAERNQLLHIKQKKKWKRKRTKQLNNSFQPKITSRGRSKKNKKPIYERSVESQSRRRKKQILSQSYKENQMKKICTFKPQFSSRRNNLNKTAKNKVKQKLSLALTNFFTQKQVE